MKYPTFFFSFFFFLSPIWALQLPAVFGNQCCQFPVTYVARMRQFSRCSHAIIDRKDREVEIGGAGEIIKRSQSVTHRLLSANTEEDQTGPCSETPHNNSRSLTHIHILYVNRGKCVWGMKKCKRVASAQPFETLIFFRETDRSRSGDERRLFFRV